MSKTHDPGKWAERVVQQWLETRSLADASFAYHRYPDARSARGALAAQPADFLVARRGRGFHLEVKETAQPNRLPKAKVGQYGKLKLFNLAGFDAIVLVYRSAHNDWVFFNEDQLFCYDFVPPSFPFAGLTSYPYAGAALEQIFK